MDWLNQSHVHARDGRNNLQSQQRSFFLILRKSHCVKEKRRFVASGGPTRLSEVLPPECFTPTVEVNHSTMKSRILFFLIVTVCCAAQIRPTAVRGRASGWDGKLFVDTAAASPFILPVSVTLPTGSSTVENGKVSTVMAPLTTMTVRDLGALPEVFSDGRQMLGETSGVPSPEIRSGNVPKDEAVRNAVQPMATVTLPIRISDVTGLSAALSQINNSIDSLNARLSDLSTTAGNLSTTVNTLADTVANLVRVPTFVDFELPVGSIDGSNPVFVLSTAPTPPSSLALYKNGMKLSPGFDYSLSGNTILFVTGAVPQAGDLVTARYRVTANPSAVLISH
jgi:hypothetical protein